MDASGACLGFALLTRCEGRFESNISAWACFSGRELQSIAFDRFRLLGAKLIVYMELRNLHDEADSSVSKRL